jgi:hypothetical protein
LFYKLSQVAVILCLFENMYYSCCWCFVVVVSANVGVNDVVSDDVIDDSDNFAVVVIVVVVVCCVVAVVVIVVVVVVVIDGVGFGVVVAATV